MNRILSIHLKDSLLVPLSNRVCRHDSKLFSIYRRARSRVESLFPVAPFILYIAALFPHVVQ